MTQQVRIALLGAGRMAAVHARNISASPDAHLVAVAGGSRAPVLAKQYEAAVLTPEQACASSGVDAVVIATPNALHADHVELACASGKAVLVEKPVDLDLDRVDACIERVGEAASRVVVAFNRRFDPSFADVRARVERDEIGPLQQLLITSRDPAPPPLEYVPGSGGLLRDMTIHDFDMVRFLAGDVEWVQASVQSNDLGLAGLSEPSGAAVMMMSTAGALVSVVNARSNAGGYDQRLEAYGPFGTLSVDNPTTTLVRRSSSRVGDGSAPLISFYGDRYAAAYRSEIEHLVAVTRGAAAPLASLHDGRAALALSVAAEESVRTGTRVAPR